MASSNFDTDLSIPALLNHDNSHPIGPGAGATAAAATSAADAQRNSSSTSRMGKARGSFSTNTSSSRVEETPTSTTATLSIGGMSSRNGTAASYGGLRVSLDSSSDDMGYEPVRSCSGEGVGAPVDFENRHSSSRPGIGNDKGVALPAGTFKANQKEEQHAAASDDDDELHKRDQPRSNGFSSSSAGLANNPQTPRIPQQHHHHQQQLPPQLLPQAAAADNRGRMTLASAGSVGSSFQSLSRGSLSSFGMGRTPTANTSARKIMVSNLPRHSRRNKKPNEITWLRDTLSLTSSTHSKEISYHDSGSEFNLHLLNSSTNDMLGAGPGHQSASSINEDGNDFNDSNGEFGVCVVRDNNNINITSNNQNATERQVPELFPKAATLPLPSIMASSMSSQSEEASSSSEDGGDRDDDNDDDEVEDDGKPETIPEGKNEGESQEGRRSRELELQNQQQDDKGAEEEDEDDDINEEEEESDAPIKWITATISSLEEEQLPPPPPRDRSRRRSPSPPRRSRSPDVRDRSRRSRGPGKDRWGGQEKSSNSGFEEQQQQQRRRSPQSNWSPRKETSPHGQNKMNDSGGGRSARRGGDNRGEDSPRPATKMGAARGGGGGNRREGDEGSRYGGHRSGDGYYDDHEAPPAQGRSKELRDNSYSRQEEQSHYSRGGRHDGSPSRHGGGEGRSRYPHNRDRHEPRTSTRAPERYPSRDRSPERYPPSDRSPERYSPKDRSPERYAPGESPSVYSRRENSPRNYTPRDRYPSRRDGSPSERRSQRHHRSDWGHSSRQNRQSSVDERSVYSRAPPGESRNRHSSVDERSMYSRAPPGESRNRHSSVDERSLYSRAPPGESRGGYSGAPEESPYRRGGEDERSVYSRRREDPYERDYGGRRGAYDSDPYRGHRGGGRDDSRRLPPTQEDDHTYSRERYDSHYHSSEVDGRRSHRNSPRYRDDPYHHRDDRSAYHQHDEDRNRYGRGERSYSRRGYSMDDPAGYDDYPGPPPIHDRHSASQYASRYDHHNDRYNDHHQQQGRYDDHYGRHASSSRQQDRSSRYDYDSPPPPAAASPRQTNQKSNGNSGQAMLEEKLRNNNGRGMDRGGNGGTKGDEVSVEISPGVHVPLRRTHETMQAIAVDFYQSVSCLSCTMDVFCIADVSYVICPSCRVISPVTGQYFEGKKLRRHGLGLGFTCESLFKMQSEIMQDRSMSKSERLEYGKQQERPGPKGPTSNDYSYERRARASISTSHY